MEPLVRWVWDGIAGEVLDEGSDDEGQGGSFDSRFLRRLIKQIPKRGAALPSSAGTVCPA